MKKRRGLWLLGGGVAVAGLAAALFFFEVQTAFYDVRVDEPLAISADSKRKAAGPFHPVAHQGRGTAEIFEANGSWTLRLSGFAIDNGPALRLRLVNAADATDSDTVKAAAFLDVGPLKGNIGDQSYELPAPFDHQVHRSVVVWCERFGVNFVTAPLSLVSE